MISSFLGPVKQIELQALSKKHYKVKMPGIIGIVWQKRLIIIRYPLMLGKDGKKWVIGTKESGHTKGQETIDFK